MTRGIHINTQAFQVLLCLPFHLISYLDISICGTPGLPEMQGGISRGHTIGVELGFLGSGLPFPLINLNQPQHGRKIISLFIFIFIIPMKAMKSGQLSPEKSVNNISLNANALNILQFLHPDLPS